MAKCKVCGYRLADGMAKCPMCGAVAGSTVAEAVSPNANLKKSFCPACGTQILGEHRYCPHCGKDLKQVAAQGESPAPKAAPVQAATAQSTARPQSQPQAQTQRQQTAGARSAPSQNQQAGQTQRSYEQTAQTGQQPQLVEKEKASARRGGLIVALYSIQAFGLIMLWAALLTIDVNPILSGILLFGLCIVFSIPAIKIRDGSKSPKVIFWEVLFSIISFICYLIFIGLIMQNMSSY